MKEFLVLTMDKTTNELRRKYIKDVEPRGVHIEEYIDSIKGELWWATFSSDIPEENAERAFLDYINHRRSC